MVEHENEEEEEEEEAHPGLNVHLKTWTHHLLSVNVALAANFLLLIARDTKHQEKFAQVLVTKVKTSG